MTYTVDEVSDLMGVPRPTLYRYLREYSIPHLRRSGKIYVPEDSFDRIKEVRELHKEGLGTESVRKRLHEESNLVGDVEGLTDRLDRISESLEELQGNPKPVNEASTDQILQTILTRQSLLISAVFNLTETLEDLRHSHGNGQARKTAIGNSEEETQEQDALPDDFEEFPEATESDPSAADEQAVATSPQPAEPLIAPTRRRRFGAMARRRRRGVLAVLLALLTSTALVVYALNEDDTGGSQEETSEPSLEAPASSEEIADEDSGTAPSAPADREEEGSAVYATEGYADPAPQQPLYQTQYAAPGAFPQEQPVLQPQLQP